jgi:hypothetical protein
MHCPSDVISEKGATYIGSQPTYMTDFRIDRLYAQELVGFNLPYSNYSGCTGAYSGGPVPNAEMWRYDGVFNSRIESKLSHVKDGLSNTVLLGESLGHIVEKKRISTHSWFFGGLCRARGNLNWQSNSNPREPGFEIIGDEWFSYPVGFASMHPATANFAHVDGSVHTYRKTIQWHALYSLCGQNDGILNQD